MKRVNSFWRKPLMVTVLGSLMLPGLNAVAQDRSSLVLDGKRVDKINALRLPQAATATADMSALRSGTLDQSLMGASGPQTVIVHLKSSSTSALPKNRFMSTAQHKIAVESEQSQFLSRSMSGKSGIRELGRVQHVLNAVFLEVPASELKTLARDPMVTRIAPVANYQLDLSETVPYVGGTAVQASGYTGKGIRVAVLDSGVDYHHADLGGSGDTADYLANDPTLIEPGSFPTAKVTSGFDFVGSLWPNGPILPDPDPLDDGVASGHGSHVADIIAGSLGMAPDAEIVAVKVCSSVSSSCAGISLILGMDYAVDPNGDGDTADRVDIINMSLGSGYGQPFDDDLSQAVENASKFGVLTVASAGNCGDKPYCTGSPAAAPSALSVAQTQVPSARGFFMAVTEPEDAAGLYGAVKYAWTPEPSGVVAGAVQYGDLDSTNLNGCDPFTGDLSGQIVAVDRGACAFSQKIRNIENAGGILGIVMLITPDAPFAGAFGGGDPISIPGFNISQADGDILRAGNASVEFSSDLTVSFAGYTVSSTARGPDMSFNNLKPEIGAPGASISAEAGTGTVRTPFGGTSGAAPMVAGAAALLQEKCKQEQLIRDGYPGTGCEPFVLKTLMVNTGFRDVISDTTDELAEISRIGGGELRVDDAAASTFYAYSSDQQQPTIAFGFRDLAYTTTILRELTVVNTVNRFQVIQVDPTFRFADDEASGAVTITPTASFLLLEPFESRNLKISVEIDPSKLSGNTMSSGVEGNDPSTLTAAEYDGYVIFRNARSGEEAAIPWHIIPRQAAALEVFSSTIEEGDAPTAIDLYNDGAGVSQNDTYSLIGLSDELPRGDQGAQAPTPDLRAVGVRTFLVPTDLCTSEFLWTFAVNTWDRQTHLVPVSHQIAIDTNRDGIDDYIILNRDASFDGVADGRQFSWVLDTATGASGAFFGAEHATNTGNTVLTVCGEQLGLSSADILATQVDISVTAQDFYFGGPNDLIDDITVTPLGDRFFAEIDDVPAETFASMQAFDLGAWSGDTEQLGLMLLTNADRGAGARGGATESTEMQLLLTPAVTQPTPLP